MERKEVHKLIDLKTAKRLIDKNIEPLDPILSAAVDSIGCILSENIWAKITQPPFDRSPLDGYAIKSSDSKNASKDNPVHLRVVGKSLAGEPSSVKIEDGEAVRIMTGGLIPRGADCVIRQEDTDKGAEFVNIFEQLDRFSNYCHKGEDYKTGELLAGKGMPVTAAVAAVAAGSGYDKLPCIPKIRVAIISTGDELKNPAEELSEGHIYDANTAYLNARISELGGRTVCHTNVKDKTSEIISALQNGLESADMIITTGGVSVGEKDLIPSVLKTMSADIHFHSIEMKPGMPTLFASINDKPVLSLSGNPFSAVVAFEILGRHIIARLTGNNEILSMALRAELQNDFNKASPYQRFIRGTAKDGKVSIPKSQGNGQLSTMVGSNCLVDIPGGSKPLKAGAELTVYLI
jgi:molybdopterin molybdotransferase